MKYCYEFNGGYISVEAAILIAVIISIVSIFITIIINEFLVINVFCKEMMERSNEFNHNNPGEVLRILKALSETGGELVNGLLQP